MSDTPILSLARRTALAADEFRSLDATARRSLLLTIADTLETRRDAILAANAQDLAEARQLGFPAPVAARLEIDRAQYSGLVHRFRTLADFPDPVGSVVNEWVRPNGLQIRQVRVPIGVVGITIEARPAVVAEAAALCLKIGNALVIVADPIARRTCLAFADTVRDAGITGGLPRDAVQLAIADGPQTARDLARAQGLVDILVPRGSPAYVADIARHATVPVLKHLAGDTHLVVDASADLDMALAIARDACFAAPWSCTSSNTVLLHARIAEAMLWKLAAEPPLRSGDFLVHPDERAAAILGTAPAERNVPVDGDRPTLRIEIIDDVGEAIARINDLGSHVADGIVTETTDSRSAFLRNVDSACACVNASPRFANGDEFGMGGEVGFSTDKIHARGPLGLEALTTLRYLVCGKGQVRE